MAAPHSLDPELGVLDALADLADRIDGELHLDPLHRMLYATDASLYAEEPIGVVYPRHKADVVEVVRTANRLGVALIPRTAGTSLSGQCVGRALVIDTSRHMTRILEVDPDKRTVRVEPGVILDELNRHLKPLGLFFGPDTSTSNRCMIGGMVGNNSCGSHSILYGTTRDHVLELEVVLADGTVARFGDLSNDELERRLREDSREGELHRALTRIVDTHRDELLARFPKPEVKRRNMGYPLDVLARSARYEPDGLPWNLARFLCGSEGTLAVTTEIVLNLVPAPTHRIVVACHFHDMLESLEATVAAIEHDPAAVELIDRRILEATRNNLEQARNREFVVGDPDALLVVEFYRHDRDAVEQAAADLIERFQREGRGYAWVPLRGAELGRAWDLRKAGLGLLFGIQGDVKPLTFVEDTAVAVEDLPEYVRRFEQIMARHDTKCVYYAHASVGELHLRPELNPKDPADIERMIAIATEVADLVREFRGTISGEHGDGRIRSPFIERMLGPTVTRLLAEVKDAFDPRGIMNPRNIVDPRPLDQDLRYPPGKPAPQLPTHFAYSEDFGSLLGAVERCNGAGACRKLVGSGGTMCPSYMATRDEVHTTRGRANVFRSLLMGDRPQDAFSSPELHDALDLCLQCKGCKAECPASVDMARLKSEFLQGWWDHHGGPPLRIRLLGQPERAYKLAQRFSTLSNKGARSRLGKAVLRRIMGVHPRRDLPDFAPKTLRQQLKRRGLARGGRLGRVVFVIDPFTDYNDPHIGLAAIDLLEAAGYEVVIPEVTALGRPQISKGLLREARALAERNVEQLLPYAREGLPILGVEPSELLTLVDEYPELVPAAQRDDALLVGAQADLVELFIGRGLRDGRFSLPFDGTPRKVLVHGHCHQKALLGNAPLLEALRAVPGFTVEAIASGCCGMAGSFGYEHFEVSMAVGELVLFPTVREAPEDVWLTAPGTSCRHQIKDGTGRLARHPIELMRAALTPAAG